jgi:hypothetical protein
MRPPVAPGELAGRRRGGHLSDRAQLGAGLVGAQPLEIKHRIAAAQLRLGDRDQQLPGRAAAGALLDRPQPTDLRRRLDRAIKRQDQLQPPHQLTDYR